MPKNENVNIIFIGKDKVSGVTGKVGSALKGLGKLALAGTGVAAGAIAGVGAALGKLAIDALPLQGISSAFNGITANIEGGSERMLEALQRGSAGMITQRDLMQSFNQAASLVSVDFAQRLPDAMSSLGKVAASTGQDMGFLLDSLTTGVGRLSPQILDNLAIQVDLTAANEAYAATIGKTASELTKQEQQTALMNQVIEKLSANTAAMPDITDNAGTKWAQLGVKLSDVKDRVGMALLPIFTKLLDKVLEGADRILPVLTDFFENRLIPIIERDVIPAIEQLFAWMGENIPKAFAIAKQFWDSTLKPALTALWSFIQDPLVPILGKLFDWIGTNLPTAFKVARDLWNAILKPALTAIWNFIQNPLLPIMVQLYNFLAENVPSAFQTVRSFWEHTLRPVLEAIWRFVGERLIPTFVMLGNGIGSALSGTANVIRTVFNRVIWFIEMGINSAIGGLNRLIDAANRIPGVSIGHIGYVGLPRIHSGGLGINEGLAIIKRNELVLPLDDPKALAGIREAVAGASGPSYTIINQFGRGSVRSDRDIMELADQIAKSMQIRGMQPAL